MRRALFIFAPLSLLLHACSAAPARTDKSDAPLPATKTGAADGVTDKDLARLLIEHWEGVLEREPLWATRLGDHRYDDRLPDFSAEAREKDKQLARVFHGRAQALAAEELDAADRTTLALFIEMLESNIESEVCNFEEWSISVTGNPVTDWNELPQFHRIKTEQDGANLVARYKQIPKAIDQNIANLDAGAAKGLYANAETTKRVLTMVDSQLAQKLDEWPLLAPLKEPREGWSKEASAAFDRDLRDAVENGVKPALARYQVLIKERILPKARGDDKPGLSSLPFARPCYQARIGGFTTLSPAPSAAELHAIGQKEIERINGEMQVLGEKLFKEKDLARVLEKLRSDPSLYFSTEKEVEEKAKRALDAANARIKDYFGILPKAPCVVTRIPDYEAPFTTIAYYRQPVPDGSKPGEYFINVYQPKTRPRYEAEALAFHESVPGHHLQIAIAQELPALPAFRKHMGMTVFVEGWALYTEQLADEMGLYGADLDRMGKLSYEAWRASRLVVDTGLHAMGWSRQAAKGYMLAHTALAANNIDNEVDRYIVWPGQALAYKTGQMEILRLRKQAQEKLGTAFDMKAFHDVVLGGGAVSLPVLNAQIEAWTAAGGKSAR